MALAYFKAARDIEIGPLWRGIHSPVPQIYRFNQQDVFATKLTKEWQWWIFRLNQPYMTKLMYRNFLNCYRAFTNRKGYNCPIPRKDYINGRNLSAIYPLPVWDKPRICADAIIRGELNGKILTVEAMDGSKPPPAVYPNAAWRKANFWLVFECNVVNEKGETLPFHQNGGYPVFAPVLSTGRPLTVNVETKVPGKPYPYLLPYKV